ncbi:MAG: ATP-binding cassette domain-containing protein, partial [Chloroflexi bacterium]
MPVPAPLRVRGRRVPGAAGAGAAGRGPPGQVRAGAGARRRAAGGPAVTAPLGTARADLDGRAPADCLLRISDLTVTYGLRSRQPVRAVVDVSLEVRTGRTLALIGESGSGKSSIARAICGLAPVERGTITMDGFELTTAPDRPVAAGQRGIQIVFQDPVSALDPRWSVWRSVAEPLLRHVPSSDDRRERAMVLLERVGLDRSFGDRHPHQLSGGQRQR